MIKTLTANQNPSCFKAIENLDKPSAIRYCALVWTPNKVIVLGVNGPLNMVKLVNQLKVA